jgi:hypothetical protein
MVFMGEEGRCRFRRDTPHLTSPPCKYDPVRSARSGGETECADTLGVLRSTEDFARSAKRKAWTCPEFFARWQISLGRQNGHPWPGDRRRQSSS